MRTQASILEDIVDESVALQALHPVIFDDYLSEGWRLLGYSIVRHNYSLCRGQFCRTIPVRIKLDGFEFSKSQRKLLRRNHHLEVAYKPIALGPAHDALFRRHSERFGERRPSQVASFLGPNAHREPVTGMEFSVRNGGPNPIACSYVHIGSETMSGTYCFFDPEIPHLSLGSYTMLLELLKALELGKKYYYHGYVYDVPSQFDYKMNFHNLEAMDWKTGLWHPHERLPVRKWTDLVETGKELENLPG
jgi:arginine-tRNA-protein transferase